MTDLTSKMKTICVGRYLVDVPVGAEFSLGTALSDSVKIERIPTFANDATYRLRLNEQEQQLRAAKHDSEGTRLRSATPVNDARQTVFVYRKDPDSVRLSTVETFVSLPSVAWQVGYETNEKYMAEVVGDVTTIARSLSYRQMNTIPTVAGACVSDGLLGRTPRHSEEFFAGAHIEALSWSINLSTETSGDRPPGQHLLDRVDGAIEMAGSGSGIKKIRRAKTKVDGRPAEEYVAIYPEKNVAIFDAKLDAYGDATPQQATIKLQMEAGRLIKPDPNDPRKFLSQDEALALWDAIVKSIRIRPGAF